MGANEGNGRLRMWIAGWFGDEVYALGIPVGERLLLNVPSQAGQLAGDVCLELAVSVTAYGSRSQVTLVKRVLEGFFPTEGCILYLDGEDLPKEGWGD
jgi:hypothetical protein